MKEEQKLVNDKYFMLVLAFALLSIVGFSFGAYESYLRKYLEKENAEMEQKLIDYKWQLEQVPWICGVASE